MYTSNETVWYPFCPVWSSITCFRTEMLVTSIRYVSAVKSPLYLDYFQNTYTKWKPNIRLWMYTSNGTVWYPFCPVWSSITNFKFEIVSYKYPIRISGKITSVPRLFSEHLHQMKNKHQIMNVHIKWDCLIPILSSLVKYYQFQVWNC